MQQPKWGLGLEAQAALCSPPAQQQQAGGLQEAAAACVPSPPTKTWATATHTYRVMVDSSDILQECC